jgi:DNA-binding GntR family transcriptional regulator
MASSTGPSSSKSDATRRRKRAPPEHQAAQTTQQPRPGPRKRSETEATALLARHHARQGIEEMILAGRFEPGEKLVQEDLARQFGVARTVVREALFELQGSGLVTATDRRGVTVADLDPERIIESYDVREAIEGMTARLCCDRISRQELRELREIAEQSRDALLAERFDEGAALDMKLHKRLLAISGNRVLQETVGRSWAFRKVVNVRTPHEAELTLQGHLALLDAIAAGDPDAAERVAREQIRVGKERMRKGLVDGTFVARWVR